VRRWRSIAICVLESAHPTRYDQKDYHMYEQDIRLVVRHGTEEEGRLRLRAFRTGWTEALKGQSYTADTLRRVTWTNLGWRFGHTLGSVTSATQEDLFNLLADLQAAEPLPDADQVVE
jgi:hypothetical protein